MIRKYLSLLLGSLLALSLLLTGCNRTTPNEANSAPAPHNPAPPAPTSNASKTPLKDAVEAFLAQHADGKLLPKDTRLLSAALEDGVATLDFSEEFQKLANMGDSTEAEAQRELRKVVAKFPNIEKMRITVEGGRFDSQVTDWDTPFPVRDDEDDVTQKPGESEGGQ